MLQLAPILSNGAVFQRNQEIRVFGAADAPVTVTFLGITLTATPVDGFFELAFPPQAAGGPYVMEFACETRTHTVSDLYIGDVILVSGQSNMQFTLDETEYQLPDDPTDHLARFFHVPRLECENSFDNRWSPMTAENAGNWSAIGLHLARALRRERQVPIGIVGCYQGAAVIQAFLSPAENEKFHIDPADKHPDHTHERFALWNPPSTLYHAMLLSIVPYAVGSVVWYQGESNTAPVEATHYGDMLRAMIAEWRTLFRKADLPFVVVQINDYENAFSQEGWTIVQQKQEEVANRDDLVALVKIADLGQHHLIHPTNKFEVTQRIFEVIQSF
ncbi:MAG: hypothetical protein IKU11_03185 [Clostridia bacterium]|nr:hypothetical protein [Clostridia bacterium]